jgi:hypothetical protein
MCAKQQGNMSVLSRVHAGRLAGVQHHDSTRLQNLKEDEEELLHQSTSGLLPFFAIVHCE